MFFYIVNRSVYIILWLCNFILLFTLLNMKMQRTLTKSDVNNNCLVNIKHAVLKMLLKMKQSIFKVRFEFVVWELLYFFHLIINLFRSIFFVVNLMDGRKCAHPDYNYSMGSILDEKLSNHFLDFENHWKSKEIVLLTNPTLLV